MTETKKDAGVYENTLPREEYEKVAAEMSQLFNDELDHRADLSALNVAARMDMPKTFPAYLVHSKLITAAAVYFALAHGYVELTEKGRVSEEEKAEREKANAEVIQIDPRATAALPNAGQYL